MAYCTRCGKEVEATQGMECAICGSSLMAEKPKVRKPVLPKIEAPKIEAPKIPKPVKKV